MQVTMKALWRWQNNWSMHAHSAHFMLVDTTNGPTCQRDTASAGEGSIFQRSRPRDSGNLSILHICPTSARAPFRSDMAATWAPLGANFSQQGPNWTWSTSAQLRPNLALGPIWEQLRPKLRSIWCQHGGHSQPNPKSWRRPFSRVFSTFFSYWWMFSRLCLRRAQLGVKLLPKDLPKSLRTWLGLPCAPRLQFGVGLDRFGPNFRGPGPSCAQSGPILRTQCSTLKTCNVEAISNSFWLWLGLVQGHVAHIGFALGLTSAPDAPTQDQAHAPGFLLNYHASAPSVGGQVSSPRQCHFAMLTYLHMLDSGIGNPSRLSVEKRTCAMHRIAWRRWLTSVNPCIKTQKQNVHMQPKVHLWSTISLLFGVAFAWSLLFGGYSTPCFATWLQNKA